MPGTIDSHWVVHQRETCNSGNDNGVCIENIPADDENDEDDKYFAARQLLFDMKENRSEAINENWEEKLVTAMIQVASDNELTIIAHHCRVHELDGLFSCVGLCEERSHVAIYAWPEHSVVSLEIFTSDSDLAPTPSKAEKIVNEKLLQSSAGSSNPRIQWSQRDRGPLEDFSGEVKAAANADMGFFPLARFADYKEEVSSARSCLRLQRFSCRFLTFLAFFAFRCRLPLFKATFSASTFMMSLSILAMGPQTATKSRGLSPIRVIIVISLISFSPTECCSWEASFNRAE